MKSSNKKASLLLLLPIVFVAVAVRAPGLFWGMNLHRTPHFINYHYDEPHLVKIAKEFLVEETDEKENYLKGFSFQMALGAKLIKPFTVLTTPKLIIIGRALSLLYGILTVIIIYFLALELFSNSKIALIASAFLALSGLHITQSHYATVDIGTTFWLYATVLFSLLSIRRDKKAYFIAAVFCCGLAMAFKLAWVALIPIFYVLIRQRKKPLSWALALMSLVVVFIAANGFHYTLNNFNLTIKNVIDDNINPAERHNRLLNPLIYFIELAVGLGLPATLLLLYGTARLLPRKVNFKNILSSVTFFIVILPLLLYFVSVCFLDIPFSRHILPLIPSLALLSGYCLIEIQRSKTFRKNKIFIALLAIILIYQLIYSVSTEYYFVFDTREAAYRWIKNNVPPGEEIATTRYVNMPSLKTDYVLSNNLQSPYIILHETYYFRYLRSELNPLKKYPHWDEIHHGHYKDYLNIQQLLKGESNYRLLKKFDVKCVTPELLIYKIFLGTYPLFIGDTLIYRQTD